MVFVFEPTPWLNYSALRTITHEDEARVTRARLGWDASAVSSVRAYAALSGGLHLEETADAKLRRHSRPAASPGF